MNSILSNSIKSLKKCYKGTDETGSHIIDKSEMDELAFSIAVTQVSMAIKKGILTEEKFISLLSAGFGCATTKSRNTSKKRFAVDFALEGFVAGFIIVVLFIIAAYTYTQTLT